MGTPRYRGTVWGGCTEWSLTCFCKAWSHLTAVRARGLLSRGPCGRRTKAERLPGRFLLSHVVLLSEIPNTEDRCVGAVCVLGKDKVGLSLLLSGSYSFLVCAGSERNSSLRCRDVAGHGPSCHTNLVGVGQVLSPSVKGGVVSASLRPSCPGVS